MIANKWKRFAVSQTLSDWGDIDSADLFDCMMIEDEKGLEKLFEKWEVIVWQPFENDTLLSVANHIDSLARSAQEVADYDE